jgi:hypothetical protein
VVSLFVGLRTDLRPLGIGWLAITATVRAITAAVILLSPSPSPAVKQLSPSPSSAVKRLSTSLPALHDHCPPPVPDAPTPFPTSKISKIIKVAEWFKNSTALVYITKYQLVPEI